uniref:Uncharacterized protein n=1 Tax=Ditylenchus dipsaci TaxID=166011 RepID=A0A915EQ00_9BILA
MEDIQSLSDREYWASGHQEEEDVRRFREDLQRDKRQRESKKLYKIRLSQLIESPDFPEDFDLQLSGQKKSDGRHSEPQRSRSEESS